MRVSAAFAGGLTALVGWLDNYIDGSGSAGILYIVQSGNKQNGLKNTRRNSALVTRLTAAGLKLEYNRPTCTKTVPLPTRPKLFSLIIVVCSAASAAANFPRLMNDEVSTDVGSNGPGARSSSAVSRFIYHASCSCLWFHYTTRSNILYHTYL